MNWGPLLALLVVALPILAVMLLWQWARSRRFKGWSSRPPNPPAPNDSTLRHHGSPV